MTSAVSVSCETPHTWARKLVSPPRRDSRLSVSFGSLVCQLGNPLVILSGFNLLKTAV